ncbi:hypothetical protein ONZ43_g4486 [Nemania bipapillata]|uniref:Uncharacterized protein n=1 Tax=Nemania bipapillata TaxID=110536 RepID=A0ACC2IM79_9PEZI|nr:hypothetical protein ONZ43_g4486 [Nemania bipapillata]
MSELQLASPSSLPSSFPQFALLPIELRISIWEIGLEEPRTLRFLHVSDGYVQRTLMINDMKFVCVPVFFFINRECRDIAVKQYTEVKAQFKARTDIPGHCFPSLELNLLIKNGDKLEFHGILPCYTVFPPEATDQHVRVQWEYPQGSYDVLQANRWLESLPSSCDTEEKTGAGTFPDVEMTCTMDIWQLKPPYFAFDMPASHVPIWTCVLVQSREEVLDQFQEWERIHVFPHLFAWLRMAPPSSFQQTFPP